MVFNKKLVFLPQVDKTYDSNWTETHSSKLRSVLTIQLPLYEVHPVADFILHNLDVLQQVQLPLLV